MPRVQDSRVRTLREMRKHFHRDLRDKIIGELEGLQPASARGPH